MVSRPFYNDVKRERSDSISRESLARHRRDDLRVVLFREIAREIFTRDKLGERKSRV